MIMIQLWSGDTHDIYSHIIATEHILEYFHNYIIFGMELSAANSTENWSGVSVPAGHT